MKYLKSFNDLNTKKWCRQYGIKNYTIVNGLVNVDGDVDLSYLELNELPFQFGIVTGDFICRYNQLTSLTGCPEKVGGYFHCGDNQLKSLVGGPTEVICYFNCQGNQLTSLAGAPQSVGGDFYCGYNQLTSLIGCPTSIGGEFYCSGHPVTLIWDWFKKKDEDFLNKISFIYTDLWLDNLTIQVDVLEQIAEELRVQLPLDYQSQLIKKGYKII